LAPEQVASDNLETFDVVHVLAEKRNPYHRSGCHLSGQLGDVSLLTSGDDEEFLEVPPELVVGERIRRRQRQRAGGVLDRYRTIGGLGR
jgi:hypothetical protein